MYLSLHNKSVKMIKVRIGTALKYFKNQFELAVFKKNKNCDKCCDLYEYEVTVAFVNPDNSWAIKNTDSADLLPFNDPDRSGSLAVHYINCFGINGINILGNTNWFTDTFRRMFTKDSLGNRGELDFVGDNIQNAKSWAKNYNNFINNKIQSNNIKAYHYIGKSKYAIDVTGDSIYYFKCYVVVPKGVLVNNIQQARWDSSETTLTGWSFNPVDSAHQYPATLIKEVNCDLI